MQVTVYRDTDHAVNAEFDVAPRVGERLLWHDPVKGGDAVHEVTTVMHQPGASSFAFVIGITLAP